MTGNTSTLTFVNDTELYTEARGSGPALLLVPGAGGDAGQYEALAELLSRDHTVVTYDRRGNSRSARPPDWAATTVAEQADDAAALLDTLGLAPATVFGSSLGAVVALGMLARHPRSVRKIVVHDPALMAVLREPEAVLGAVQPVIGAGMAAGGPRGGMEAFLRFADASAYGALDPAVRDRMLGNGDVLFEYEFGTFASWRPDGLVARSVPATVLHGQDSPPFLAETSAWVAGRLGVEVRPVAGGHMSYVYDPAAMAEAIRH